MDKLTEIIGPILISFYIAKELSRHQMESDLEIIAKVFDKVAGLLLPILIIVIIKGARISEVVLAASIIGFWIPIILYAATPWLNRILNGPAMDGASGARNRLLFSSFGGGNRGNLLLVLLGSSGLVTSGAVTYFIALDLGNLFCLVTLGFLIAGRLNAKEKEPWRLSEMTEKVMRSPVFIAILVIVSQFPSVLRQVPWLALTDFDPIIDSFGASIKSIFAIFVFVPIFLRAENLDRLLTQGMQVIRLFLGARIIPALAIFACAIRFNSDLLAAIGVLIAMPPSSYLWTKLSTNETSHSAKNQKANPSDQSSNNIAMYLAPNVFYFIFIGGLFFYDVLIQHR